MPRLVPHSMMVAVKCEAEVMVMMICEESRSTVVIPGSSRYVKFLPFGVFFWWKGTNFTHLEDPGIRCI